MYSQLVLIGTLLMRSMAVRRILTPSSVYSQPVLVGTQLIRSMAVWRILMPSCVYSQPALVGTLSMRSMAAMRILTPRHEVNINNVKDSGQSNQKTLFVLIRKTNAAVQRNNHYLFLEPYQTY